MTTSKKTIKPIETVYDGHRFRSRLEARWAVFFNELGVLYEYEPEGYDLGGGDWYLPDFRFPNGLFGVEYAEVKPYQGDEEFVVGDKFPKLDKFAKHFTVALLDGQPDFVWYYVGGYYEDDDIPEWLDNAMLYDQAIGEERWFTMCCIDRKEMRDDALKALKKENGFTCFEDKYKSAVLAARQARF